MPIDTTISTDRRLASAEQKITDLSDALVGLLRFINYNADCGHPWACGFRDNLAAYTNAVAVLRTVGRET